MPVVDPTYRMKQREAMEKEREAAERDARMEYIKPAMMLVVGAGVTMAYRYMFAGDEEISGAALAAWYLVGLIISLVFGVAGLWLLSKLVLGGVGPLGLSILRLAGIYAFTDATAIALSPLWVAGLILNLVIYIGLLMWLFELEPGESVLLAVVTWLLKVIAGFVIVLAVVGG